jgi:hypothetical protein
VRQAPQTRRDCPVTITAATAPEIAMTAPTDRSTPLVAMTMVMPIARIATGPPRFKTSIRLPKKRPSCHVTVKNPGNRIRLTSKTAASAMTCGRVKKCANGREGGSGGSVVGRRVGGWAGLFCNGLCVVIVVLMALVERLHVDGRNDPRIETHSPMRPAEEMGAETRFHTDNAPGEQLEVVVRAGRLICLRSTKASSVKPDQMKSILADVDPDDGKLFNTSFLLRMHGCFSCR